MKTHVKIVEAFEGFAGFCSGLGGKYKPGEENLQLTALASLLAKTKAALHQVDDRKSRLDLAQSHRTLVFQDLAKRTRQVLDSLASSGVSDYVVQDARHYGRQILGYRATARPVATEPAADVANGEPKTRSVLQLAHVSRVQTFGRLLQLVEKVPQYRPAEDALKVASLKAFLTTLHESNAAVQQAQEAYAQALRTRNEVMYLGPRSLVTTARRVKTYLRSLFGHASQEYRTLTGLQFPQLVRL